MTQSMTIGDGFGSWTCSDIDISAGVVICVLMIGSHGSELLTNQLEA